MAPRRGRRDSSGMRAPLWVVVLVAVTGCSDGRRGGGNDGVGGGGSDGGGGMMMTNLPPLSKTVIGNGAPADAPTHFGGPDDLGAAPSLVYPADGVMMPPNISMLEVQFTAA